MEMNNYWLVGANWDGDDLKETFFLRGYWEMGYEDSEKPAFAEKRNSVKKNDRIAIKKMDGQGANTVTILALGIVKEVADKKIFIDWKLTDLNRQVPSKGAFATIHGPYSLDDHWTWQVFCI